MRSRLATPTFDASGLALVTVYSVEVEWMGALGGEFCTARIEPDALVVRTNESWSAYDLAGGELELADLRQRVRGLADLLSPSSLRPPGTGAQCYFTGSDKPEDWRRTGGST